MYNVKFLKGTLEAYNGLATKDSNTFYYAGNDLFLGEIKLSNGADLADAILRIAANETDIDNLQSDIKALTGGETGSISGMITEAVAAAKTELRKEIKANSDAIDAIEADYLKGSDKTELANSIKAISDDYLKGSDKTALEGKIQANTDAITTLNGDSTVTGSVDKKVADAINAFATQVSDDDTINTYKEILNYLATHKGDATDMAAAIDALETKVGEKSVQTQITEAFTTANLGQYATDEDLNGLTKVVNGKASQTDLDTAEGKIETLEGKLEGVTKVTDSIEAGVTEAKGYTDTEIGKLSTVYEKAGEAAKAQTAAETYAKNYADGLASNYDKSGAAATAESNAITSAKEYTNTEIEKLSTVYDANGSAAQALVDAKAYADGLATNYDAAGSASAAQAAAKSYTDNAILALDADVTSAAVETGKGVQVQVVEVDGKITNVVVSGNYNNSYDAKGAAATAKTEAVSAAATDATTKANTAEANAKEYVDNALTWGTIA